MSTNAAKLPTIVSLSGKLCLGMFPADSLDTRVAVDDVTLRVDMSTMGLDLLVVPQSAT